MALRAQRESLHKYPTPHSVSNLGSDNEQVKIYAATFPDAARALLSFYPFLDVDSAGVPIKIQANTCGIPTELAPLSQWSVLA